MKKTLLTIIAALLLGGVVNAQDWGETDSHAKSSNTPIVASVTLDGNAVTPTADYRLGAFVGEELRGLAAPHTDNNFWIQVFYNQGTTETISFKLYDGTNEYTTCSVTQTTQEEGWGTPSEPVVLDFATTQTQSITLVDGWNWWGTNIELEGNNGLQQLKDDLGTNCVKIKSRTDGNLETRVINGNLYWLGSLNAIHNEQMYMIETNAECEVSISGQRASSSNHPISINPGWNWIGYPCNQDASVAVALSGFTPENGDKIKGRTGSAEYYAVANRWLGTLTLEPGKGYMYLSKSSDTKTLLYQTGRQDYIVDNGSNNMAFQPEIDNYAHNMIITAVIDIDGEELRSDEYEIAAFVGNECRGSVKLMYAEPLDRYVAFLLVFGDKEENMHFVLSNGRETSWSNDYILYSSDGIVGSLSEPAVLHFRPLGFEENAQFAVNVYPNPSKGIYNIEGFSIHKVEIIDIFGQVIYSKEVNDNSLQIDLGNRAIGTYFLRVVTDNGVLTQQLIKE